MASVANRKLTGSLLALALGMFGFGFLLIPAYDMFCEALGITGNSSPVLAVASLDESRTIKVEFVTHVVDGGRWQFAPEVKEVYLHPGEFFTGVFTTTNATGRDTIAQAIPSVMPVTASKYFIKSECFCFNPQPFADAQTRDLGVRFVVDRDLPKTIDTITLSYTLYEQNTST